MRRRQRSLLSIVRKGTEKWHYGQGLEIIPHLYFFLLLQESTDTGSNEEKIAQAIDVGHEEFWYRGAGMLQCNNTPLGSAANRSGMVERCPER